MSWKSWALVAAGCAVVFAGGRGTAMAAAAKITVPAAPSYLRVANVWSATVDLNWDDRSSNESEFLVAISRDGGATWDNVGRTAANAVSFRVDGLRPSTPYAFRVRAGNAAGYSAFSGVVSVTTRAAPPAAPSGLVAANVWQYVVDLNWIDRASDETEYLVAISRDGGATFDNVARLAANSTAARISGLKAGTRYLFKVRASNAAGFSDYSNQIAVTTRP